MLNTQCFRQLVHHAIAKWGALLLTHVGGGPNAAPQRTSALTVPFAVHTQDGGSNVYPLTSSRMTSTY